MPNFTKAQLEEQLRTCKDSNQYLQRNLTIKEAELSAAKVMTNALKEDTAFLKNTVLTLARTLEHRSR